MFDTGWRLVDYRIAQHLARGSIVAFCHRFAELFPVSWNYNQPQVGAPNKRRSRTRSLLIGINYNDHKDTDLMLPGPDVDVENMKMFIKSQVSAYAQYCTPLVSQRRQRHA